MVPADSPRSFLGRLRAAFSYPQMRGIDLDSAEATIRRRSIAREDPPTRFAFELWYRRLQYVTQDAPTGKRIELGSGGGFLEEYIPALVKTDVLQFPFTDLVCQAEDLPFDDAQISCIYLINVLHHVENPEVFFAEAARVLRPGGLVAMIEPTVTIFSRLVYRFLHHEPFDPDIVDWKLPPAGRMSGGNDALPWVIFFRDRHLFTQRFPSLRIKHSEKHDCLVHLLAGGVTTRSFIPVAGLRALAGAENGLPFLARVFGLFQTIVLERQ